jgi:hypothetical protein
MPAMKKVCTCTPDLFIPEKRCCFWVGVVMQTVRLSLRKQQNTQSYVYVVLLTKITENTLQQ